MSRESHSVPPRLPHHPAAAAQAMSGRSTQQRRDRWKLLRWSADQLQTNHDGAFLFFVSVGWVLSALGLVPVPCLCCFFGGCSPFSLLFWFMNFGIPRGIGCQSQSACDGKNLKLPPVAFCFHLSKSVRTYHTNWCDKGVHTGFEYSATTGTKQTRTP